MPDEHYRIHAPAVDLTQLGDSKRIYALLANPIVKRALEKANAHYYHWEELRFKDWIPSELFPNKESFWALLKLVRSFDARATPIQDVSGYFYHLNIDYDREFLHILDKEMASSHLGIADFSSDDKTRFVARNLIEESIASSQLEGANTSRSVAKKMLLEGRKPKNHGEQMIQNNYNAMRKIEQAFSKEELSWELLCELHCMITYKTMPEDKQGVLRETLDKHGHKLVIRPWRNGKIAYTTPPKEFVKVELNKLLSFANDIPTPGQNFVHPLVKGIMLHFWLGLLHPFEDGNGRLARIIFYWYMLKNEYWAFAYLSLSEKIMKSAGQYTMAYIYSEQDDYDLTYFINYNFAKLKLARKDFQTYLKSQIDSHRLLTSATQKHQHLNDRQLKLLHYLKQKKTASTSVKMHQEIYAIGRATASRDLNELVKLGLMLAYRKGKHIYYSPTEKVQALF